LGGYGGRKFLDVRSVGKFMRLVGSENFVSLGRSGNLGSLEVWKDWEGGRFSRMFSPVINVFLELHVDCLCYISIDYRTERLVHSITIVQIRINISTYIYIYILLCCSSCPQKHFWDTNTATMFS
jgi:hypothetical protein